MISECFDQFSWLDFDGRSSLTQERLLLAAPDWLELLMFFWESHKVFWNLFQDSKDVCFFYVSEYDFTELGGQEL